jgi:hypothetical protein
MVRRCETMQLNRWMQQVVASAFIVVLAARAAHADDAPAKPSEPVTQPAPQDRSHFRFGIGGAVGVVGDSGGAFGLGPGFYVRLGHAMNDGFGIDFDLSAGFLVVTVFGRVAALGVWTPNDARSYAVGPAVSFYGSGAGGAGGTGGSAGGIAASVMGRIDFHTHRHWSGNHRSALTFGIAVDVGVAPRAPGSGTPTGVEGGLLLTIGHSRY